MYRLLYLVRTEADFERVAAIAIAGKDKFKQTFVSVGDGHPFFASGITNEFQKSLFAEHGFEIKDFCDYDPIGAILKKFSLKENIPFDIAVIGPKLRANKKLLFPMVFLLLLQVYLKMRAPRIARKILRKIKPDALLTDQSQTVEHYTPEIFRRTASQKGIPSCLFTHGAAGGLHGAFTDPEYNPYQGYYVFVCSDIETKPGYTNRIILGDMSSSFPYVHYLHHINSHTLAFLDDREYKIGFIVPGFTTHGTSTTSGWSVMEEIIIDLSANPDVAMVIKKHPRNEEFADLAMVSTFNNVRIVGSWCDRSRVVKWADIVVCGDHCSTVFEPMILCKKVVAVEGKHIPKFKGKHSPLKYSSIRHISSASEFDLNDIPNANPEDPVTNQICWGGHGKIDLAKLFLEKVEEIIESHFLQSPNV